MLWVAVVGIIEVLLKLGLAFILFAVDTDRLVIYAMGMAAVNLSSLIIYAIYSFNKFEECTTSGLLKPDMALTKELSSFTGWNLFGALCGLGRTQGFAILLNMFFGTVINAAYGIANQVASQMNFFSATLLRAINPQIMKSEGAGDRQRMLRLAMTASKFGFFLFAIIAIPCIFEMESILAFWLKEVPAYTVIFCQLTLVGVMINQLTIGLQSAIQATGKIKIYQIVVGTLVLFNLPIAYVLLKNGFEAYTVLISYALVELLACSMRIYFMKLVGKLSIQQYFKSVFLKELIPVFTIAFISYLVSSYFVHPYRFILTFVTASPLFALSIYLFGLEISEKQLIHSLFSKLKTKIQIV
jgi:Na+-driven multidrug efflux pump